MWPAFELVRRFWKPAAVLLLLLLTFFAGDHNGATRVGDRWEKRFAVMQRDNATARAAQEAEYRKRERELADQIAFVEQTGYALLQEKIHENEKLRAAVDAGAVRLRVKARCPSLPAAPEGAPGAGVDTGGTAELDPAARPAYFALRDGIEKNAAQLTACQNVLRVIVGP